MSSVSPKGNAPGATSGSFTTTFDHDSAGRTMSVTDPEGGVTERHYSGGLLVWEEDAEDNRSTYSYDDALRLVATERPDATTLLAEYWGDGSLKTRWDAAGEPTGYGYDDAGRLVTVTDPLGRVTTHGYDLEGRRTFTQAHGGNCAASPALRCTAFTYDDEDRLIGVGHSDDDGVVTPDVTGIAYDGNGRRTEMTDGTGTSTWEWNPFGELTSSTAGNGDVVSYTYDPRGLQDSVTYPGNKTVTRAFDDAGRWTGLTDWLGGTGGFGYDENSNLEQITYPAGTGGVDTFSFDDADRLSGVTYAKGAATLGSIDYGTRDANGRITTADATGLPGDDETYAYNPLDQLEHINAAVLGYDPADNLIQRADGATQVFDEANQLCWASPSGGTGDCDTAPADATTFTYDDSGNRTAEAHADGSLRHLTYDSADRLVGVTDYTRGPGYTPVAPTRIFDTRPDDALNAANGKTRVFQVTGTSGVPAEGVGSVVMNVTAQSWGSASGYLTLYPAGTTRPTATNLNYSSGATVTTMVLASPNAAGELEVFTSGAAHVMVDVLGWFADDGSYTHTQTRQFDSRTPADGAAWISGGTTTHVKVAGVDGVPSTGVAAVAVQLTVVGGTHPGHLKVHQRGTPLPEGTTLNYTAGATVSNTAFVPVDANGYISVYVSGRTHLVVGTNGWVTAGEDYTAVTPTRLLDTRTPGDGAAKVTGLRSPDLQVTGVAGVPTSGVSAVVLNVTAVSPEDEGALTVFPAGTAQPADPTVHYPAGAHVANASITTIGWVDGTGKISLHTTATAHLLVTVLGWFAEPDPITPAGTGATYAYDGDGYRTATTRTGGDTTQFTWDRSDPIPKLLSQHSGTAERTYVIYGPGGHPYAQITGTTIAYYHRDQLGSTRLLTNATGDPVGTYTYDPYGALTHSTGTATPLLGYAGEYTDPETGYTYLRARHYDPTTGQFLTRDPLEHTTGEPYGYASNNPTSYVDPLGLCGEPANFVGPRQPCRGTEVPLSPYDRMDIPADLWTDIFYSGWGCHVPAESRIPLITSSGGVSSGFEASRASSAFSSAWNWLGDNLSAILNDAASCIGTGSVGSVYGSFLPMGGQVGGFVVGCGIGIVYGRSALGPTPW